MALSADQIRMARRFREAMTVVCEAVDDEIASRALALYPVMAYTGQ